MNKITKILICFTTGFSFWIPAIIIHAIRGYDFGRSYLDIIAITILPVISAVITLKVLSKRMFPFLKVSVIALATLLGIWMFGPLGTVIGASFSGGGFTQPGTANLLISGILLFVPSTFMMSTYDGTLGALGVTTIWFIIKAILSLTSRSRGTQD